MTQRLKVMHVITGLDVGGAEGMLYALATAPAARELDQSVVSLVPGGHYAAALRQAGVRVESLNIRGVFSLPGGLVALARMIGSEAPDIVQGWMYHADLLSLAALYLSGRRKRTRLAWGLRCSVLTGPEFAPALRIARRLWIALSGRPDAIIANSKAGIDLHAALGMHPRLALIINNGIDTTRFRPDPQARARLRRDWNVPGAARLIAHVARVDPLKDHATFLAAMERLPEARAILVGRGTEDLPRRANVTALGQRDDVPAVLAAADIAVSSSIGEGFSNVLAEGMAAGLPAAATDVGAARLILGDSGAICPPGDPNALAQALRTLLEEPPAQWQNRREAVRRRVLENFSLDRAAAAFITAYRALLENHP